MPARELHFRIFKLLLNRPGDPWRPINLGHLATEVGNSEWAELVDALKWLNKKEYLLIRKWVVGRGFVPYTTRETDNEFFYQAEFQLCIAPDGRIYIDNLQERGLAGRSKIMVYLDTNVISRLAKADMPPPVRVALVSILELFGQGKLDLVTSDLSKKEIDRLNSVPNIERDKWNLDVVVSLVKRVPFAEDHKLIGINSHWDRHGGNSSPVMKADPISTVLRSIGLDQMDAHHLMLAIQAECDVFLTLDRRTILSRRSEIETQFSIRLMDPEEFARISSLLATP